MSEDSSSDEDWNVSATKTTYYDVNKQKNNPESHVKCWECGKLTSDLPSLLAHYKSHNIEATCHICKITFCRLISLSLHLENAHLPPKCKECHLLFMNVWELNKHAETHHVAPVSRGKRPRAKAATAAPKGKKSRSFTKDTSVERSTNTTVSALGLKKKQEDGLETANHSLEYVMGEDDDEDEEEEEEEVEEEGSTSSESDAGVTTHPGPINSRADDEELDEDSDSSSTDCSSGPPSPLPPKTNPIPPHKNLMCAACGRGPFRSLKLHHLHCTGVNLKYQCCVCRLVFMTEESLKEHQMPLYSCHVCGQVFSHEKMMDGHPCPKESRSRLVLFCPEAMPKVCSICKSFFTSDKTLSAHVTRVHVSVVSTKVRFIAKPLNDKEASVGVHKEDGQSALSDSKQAFNGKLSVDETYAGSLTTRVKLSPSSSPLDGPPVPISLLPGASPDQEGVYPALPTNQLPKAPSPHSLTAHGDTETASADATPSPMPSILAMFENDSRALTKRTQTNWRLKATHPCRQCGAILRHASFIISHRYLHRGQRSHRCHCGRTFKHRLHLLRHCVQHAEAVSYICVGCGDTFMGAKHLARHLKGKSPKASCRQPKRKSIRNRKCKMTFTCDCGLIFFRPSAYIWHQLKNKKNS